MVRMLVASLLLTAAFVAGAQSQARLAFETDNLPEYYWAGDYEAASECEQIVGQMRARGSSARCAYAPRYRVWWLMAKNVALLQLPTLMSGLR